MQSQLPNQETEIEKVLDIVRRLEEWLFRKSNTKEDYMNLETLETRLCCLIRGSSQNNYTQQSSSVGTMIPAPVMPQISHPSVMETSSMDSSINIAANNRIDVSAVSKGNALSFGNGPLKRINGLLFNMYQQSSSKNAINSVTNMLQHPIGLQIMSNQMIPTPGFNNNYNQSSMNLEHPNGASGFSNAEGTTMSQSVQQQQHVGGQNMLQHPTGLQIMLSQMIPTPVFNNNYNQSSMNLEPPNGASGFSNAEGTTMSQSVQQQQHVGGQNICIVQKSYGFLNGDVGGGFVAVGNNMQLVNAPVTSKGYSNDKKRKLRHDQPQRPMMLGDRHGIRIANSSGSTNLYGSMPNDTSMMNNRNLSSATLPTVSRTTSSLMASQSNLHTLQQSVKSNSIDQSENVNFQSWQMTQNNFLQSQQCQQFPLQQHKQFQHQQFIPDQQQRPQNQQRHILLSQSHLTSNVGSQLKAEPGLGFGDEVLQPQVSNQFQQSDLQRQQKRSFSEYYAGGYQLLSIPPVSRDICSSMGQQMQQVQQPQRMVAESQTKFSSISNGIQLDVLPPGQLQSRSEESSQIPGNFSHEQNVQEEFYRSIIQGEALFNYIASEGNQTLAFRTVEPPNSLGAMLPGNQNRHRDFKNVQKFILILIHSHGCKTPEGTCPVVNCKVGKKINRHITLCNTLQCTFPYCSASNRLITHINKCTSPDCPFCFPVRKIMQGRLQAREHSDVNSEAQCSVGGICKPLSGGNATISSFFKPAPIFVDASEDRQPSSKRIKLDPSQLFIPDGESFVTSGPFRGGSHTKHGLDHPTSNTCMPMKPEGSGVKMEIPANAGHVSSALNDTKMDIMDHIYCQNPAGDPVMINNLVQPAQQESIQCKKDVGQQKQENISLKDTMDDIYCQKPAADPVMINNLVQTAQQENIQCQKDVGQQKQENRSLPTEDAVATKSGKPKIKAVSLTELFTPEQVWQHIGGLSQPAGEIKLKVEKNQALKHSMNDNSCQLCASEKLTFEPPPMYCTPCGARIKRNAMYYTMGAVNTHHYFCTACYNKSRGDIIIPDGTSIPKSKLVKKKNDDVTEEGWVQCDNCGAWQHQICGLFNSRINDGGQAEYNCPYCYLGEVERGERMPLPQSSVLGATDLPSTMLSSHIEQRLFKRLKHERQERAKAQGKSYDEVPDAEALVVRVVSSVDKKLEVKPWFLENFQEEKYPTEFPYKSKAVLLFQKIEGVDVCILGMYVQEFGSECEHPNNRRVYLSYLDSVKYFRPDVKTVKGEALRTFVYQEFLIGYLEHCRNRGFTSCYIWACPPLKGEDYILNCHPEIQKTPKSDKLRKWYLSMLRKAMDENIVSELTNVYEHFFITTGESKARVTAARLPYFDGDYWPNAIEDAINQIRHEEEEKNKKGIMKKTITKRSLKASGQSSKDLILMHKLGEKISPMKEDFILVHLQPSCSHCCKLMIHGNRWVCKQCKKFHICDDCYEAEEKREDSDRHPINQRDVHILHPVKITGIPKDTTDKDEIIESEFFNTRQAFLSLCQRNHYQYDTLRRAKHSTMMILFHLHNPTVPAFVMTCSVCFLVIEAGHGWHCEVCPEYDVCNSCYQKGEKNHLHPLTNHSSMADRDTQSKEARQLQQARPEVKGLFNHGINCKVRAVGDCVLCKKMWSLLQLHARDCKVSECLIPRCREFKSHMKRSQHQSDSRRRAVVMEMVKQRKAEVDEDS